MQLSGKTIRTIKKQLVLHFQHIPMVTGAELGDLLGITRQIAVTLLDYFDLNKYTLREDNIRRPGPKLWELIAAIHINMQ